MNDTIIKDTLKVASETITKSIDSESNDHINWWLWIAIIEFVLIVFLVIKQKIKPNNTLKQKFKKESCHLSWAYRGSCIARRRDRNRKE